MDPVFSVKIDNPGRRFLSASAGPPPLAPGALLLYTEGGKEAEPVKSVLIRMNQYRAQASGAERGVLDCVLENPEAAAQYSIHRLAELSYTSPSTVVRICRKLGFEGYRDLQKSLLYEVAIRQENKTRRGGELEHTDQLTDIIDKVTYRNIASLENSRMLVEPEAIRKSVDLICASGTVLLFGMGASFLVAQDAYQKFLRVGKSCALSEDIHCQYVHARNAGPDDVAIIISYTGYTEEILRCAKSLRRQGTPIIAITRFEPSPLSQMSDCNLYVVAMEETFRSGAMSSRIAQLNMIDILYTAYFNRNYDQSLRNFERTQISKKDL